MKIRIPPALLSVVLLCACLGGGGAPEDGGFNGETYGCADFIILRANGNGKRVLEIRSYSDNIPGSGVYEVDVAEWEGTVRVSSYNQKGALRLRYCNDVMHEVPVRLSRKDAMSGHLILEAYEFQADTMYWGDSSQFYVWKNYHLNAELTDVLFEDGSRIPRVRIDSVHVGWLAG
jgi:hypothetical protein